ncbi:HlyD family secretion protein [Pseudooceanicola antarcticus]|uniref:HlyD family secretion protein n=1 Tax=Pseudooceanicola antarcticus TaxID=1247613 RepID=A0A285J1B2_9RHOB|nr:HlyD family secretion protein [Pseudooceanicola antarcticus]PJE29887.1 HlyD family secretion protein [Pseudooceanicola antarcticus]SNY53998.1 HlyD family secretion protein [Pseudooceanicola antarcticus]
MRYARLLFGFALILLALWVIVGEQISGASANAVVNAPVVTLRADVSGRLALPDRTLGARVERSEALASITNELVERDRLDDLVLERGLVIAGIARMNDDLAAAQIELETLRTRAETLIEQHLAEIRTRLDHARRSLAILEGEDPAAQDGPTSQGGSAAQRAPAGPLTALTLEQYRERVELLEITLAAAERGIFLGEGAGEVAQLPQKLRELEARLGALENALAEAEGREAALTRRINRERVQVNVRTGGDLNSPVNGLFWEALQADGVVVQRGDPILRLVDCDRVLVTLTVTERIYNSLSIGQPASFRLQGNSRNYAASVTRLAGSGASTIYRNLAVAPSGRQLERYDVTLLVPELARETGCQIGKTGRAFFDRRPLDWLRD